MVKTKNMELPIPTMDLLGDVLMNVHKFAESGFSTSLELNDPVRDEKSAAGNMFFEVHGRWHLKPASLPGDLSICAIAVDQDAIVIETAPFNGKVYAELTREDGLLFRFIPAKRHIVDKDGNLVMSISKPQAIKVDNDTLPPRCLCEVPLHGRDDEARNRAIILLDRMYSRGVFVPKEPDEKSTPVSAPAARVELKLSLSLNLELMNSLQMVQRPVLSLKTAASQRLEPAQRLELTTLFALQRQLLSMGQKERLEFVQKLIEDRGEETAYSMLIFVIAGRIKKIKPELTYKKARALARGMTMRPKK